MSPSPTLDVPATQLEPAPKELSQSLFEGLAWTGAMKWLGQLTAWASTIIVARLLSPTDYGILGMAMLYMGFMQLLTEFGVGTAVVTMDELKKEELEQLNLLAVLLGISTMVVSLLAAHPLAGFFRTSQLSRVIIVMSTTFVISSFQVVPLAILQKQLKYKIVAFFDGLRSVILAVAVITLAFLGTGYWALVMGAILSSTLTTGLILSRQRISFRWPRGNDLRHALHFSGQLLVSRISWFSWSNADFLVAGRYFGQAGLGAYTLAWNLASVPVEKITAIVLGVTPAFFSAIQRDKPELRKYTLSLTQGLALLTFPAAFGLALEARNFVLVVLGNKWEAAILPLQLLAVSTVLRSLTPVLSQVLIVARQTKFEMIRSIFMAVLMPIGFLLGKERGLLGVAAIWLIVYPLLSLPLFLKSLNYLECSAVEYFLSLRVPLLGSCVMCATVLLTRETFNVTTGSIKLAAEIAIGALSYGCIVLMFAGDRVNGLRKRLTSAMAV